MNGYALLTPDQTRIAKLALAEESAKREHIVVYLSGAHAYGFPSPDSDLDLKCIHLAPLHALIGLHPTVGTFDRAEVLEGVEIDYTSNELAAALHGILQGNGNFIERVLGTCTLQASPLLAELQSLVRRALSRRVYRHYRGFGMSQLRELEANPTVKKALYVLRTTLTGIHLLKSSEMVADVTQLLDTYGFGAAHELVSAKLAGERSALDIKRRDVWLTELTRAFEMLTEAEQNSQLPQEPANVAELNDWLIGTRLRAAQSLNS
jgi:uncharacterized protein